MFSILVYMLDAQYTGVYVRCSVCQCVCCVLNTYTGVYVIEVLGILVCMGHVCC